MKAIVGDWSTDIYPTDSEVHRFCKPGAGADTCIWLVVGSKGFECRCLNRPYALLKRWEDGQTVAKRDGCDVVNDWSPSGMEGEVEIPVPAEEKVA